MTLRSALLFALVVLAPFVGAAAQGSLELPTRAELEARIQELESLTGDEEELARQRAMLAAVARTELARRAADGSERELADALERLKTLRAKLESATSVEDPTIPVDAGLDELKKQLVHAEAALAAQRRQGEELEAKAQERAQRRTALPDELTSARRAAGLIEEQLQALSGGPDTDQRRRQLLLERDALQAEADALEAESAAIDAWRELLPLLRDEQARAEDRSEGEVDFWRTAVDERRREQAERAAREAELRFRETALRYPALSELAEENRELALLSSGDNGLVDRIIRASRGLDESREGLDELRSREQSARRRVNLGGTGVYLRRDFDWLWTERQLKQESRRRARESSEAALELFDIEERRVLARQRALSDDLLGALGLEAHSDELEAFAHDLVESQRDLLGETHSELEVLIDRLLEHQRVHEEFAAGTTVYRGYIEERLLWVRSADATPWRSLSSIPSQLEEIGNELRDDERTRKPGLARHALRALSEPDGWSVLAALVGLVLLALRRALKARRTETAELVRRYRTDRFGYTLEALVQTVLLSLPGALLTLALGLALAGSTDLLPSTQPVTERVDEWIGALAAAVIEMSIVIFALTLLHEVAKPKGLGEAHFRWPGSSMQRLRREIRWFQPLAVSVGLVVIALHEFVEPEWSNSLGRAAFIVGMVALAAFLFRLVRPGAVLFATSLQRLSLIGRTHRFWLVLSIAGPVTLIFVALSGYYYAALQFERSLRSSLALIIGLALVNGLLLRWLYFTRRRLAVLQAREKVKARAEAAHDAVEGAPEATATAFDEDQLDIPALDAQTRQLFRSGITLTTVLGLYFIWAGVLPALKGLNRVQILPRIAIVEAAEVDRNAAAELGFGVDTHALERDREAGVEPSTPGTATLTPLSGLTSSGSAATRRDSNGLPARLTLADLSVALILLMFAWIALRNVPGLLEIALLQRLPLDGGSRYAITTLVRYLLLIVGVSLVSGALGLSWEKVQWLAAALTFGLAFGLQEIFANFVSGLIILIERPVRVGDFVTVGGIEGRVTRLRMRATTVLDWDRRELLVPNKEFITTSVINWTLSDPVTRLIVPVGIAYGSDTATARELLLEAAGECPLVLDDPPATAIFRVFGESSLDFQLRVFTANRERWPETVDSLHELIDEKFRRRGVEIAFPQRDLHVRSSAVDFARAPAEGAGGADEATVD